jgi:prepilin-type N-terminal cleavage/methylation domain-containing protein
MKHEKSIMSFRKDKKRAAGFTVIEMVISLAVFLIISGVAVGIFLSVIQRQKQVLSEQELLNQISYAQEYMSRALRMAKAATSNTDLECLPVLGDVYLLTRPDSSGIYKGIKFLNQSDAVYDGEERNAMCEEFFLDNITDPGHPVLMVQKGNDPSVSAVALTSPDLKINSMRFVILGANGSDGSLTGCADPNECGATNKDGFQPRVTTLFDVFMPGDGSGSGAICVISGDCQVAGEGCDSGKCRPIREIQTSVSQRNLNVNPQTQP